MTDQNDKGRFDFTEPVTLNFEHIFTPHAYKGNEPRYEADFEIDGDSPDLNAMKKAATAVARAKWPGRDLSTLHFPWRLGDALADKAKGKGKNREHSRGKLVLKARSKYAPFLSVIMNGELTAFGDARRPLAQQYFYNGVLVVPYVTFNPYENPAAGDGINAFLDELISVRKGDRIGGGGGLRSQVFRQHVGSYTDEDPTAGQSQGAGGLAGF
ncbi:MAG: ssDNA-binding protein [Minisyncoccia bacterium]